jgi:hypothetical protein
VICPGHNVSFGSHTIGQCASQGLPLISCSVLGSQVSVPGQPSGPLVPLQCFSVSEQNTGQYVEHTNGSPSQSKI